MNNEENNNYEKKLNQLLSIEVQKRIDESNKKPSFTEKITGSIVAATALVSAIAAFSGSMLSLSSSMKTTVAQEDISRVQEQIELRQNRLDENSRISALYYSTDYGCGGIPTDEEKIWKVYRACLIEKGKDEIKDIDNITFRIFSDRVRLECAKTHYRCSKK